MLGIGREFESVEVERGASRKGPPTLALPPLLQREAAVRGSEKETLAAGRRGVLPPWVLLIHIRGRLLAEMGWTFPAEVMNLRDKGRRQGRLEHIQQSELVWALKSVEETGEESVKREKLPEDSRQSCSESAQRSQWGRDLMGVGL